MLSKNWLSRMFPYLEDILDLHEVPEVPDGHHDGWGYLHSTGFSLQFPKIYNTWCPYLEDILDLPEVPEVPDGGPHG